MICKGCGETYDEEMFPVCPFCLTENRKTEIDSIENGSNLYNVDNESVHQELEAQTLIMMSASKMRQIPIKRKHA